MPTPKKKRMPQAKDNSKAPWAGSADSMARDKAANPSKGKRKTIFKRKGK